ncbi:hypothetical protein [Amycolatopsis japonica]
MTTRDEPAGESRPYSAWDLVDRVIAGGWKLTWQLAVLLLVLGGVISSVLLAGSVTARAAAMSAMGLCALMWLYGRNTPPAPQT